MSECGNEFLTYLEQFCTTELEFTVLVTNTIKTVLFFNERKTLGLYKT